jgi:hypothetical protein
MSLRTIILGALIASVSLLFTTTTLRAAIPLDKPTPAAPTSDEINLLKQAYATLAMADHDYKGHRVKAMKAIEAACKSFGLDVTGSGKGHEQQGISDAQLKQAQQDVQQASSIAAGLDQTKVVKHLEKAISEIGIALTIK